MKMKATLLAVLMAFAPALLASADVSAQRQGAAKQEPTAEEIAERVQKFYDKTKTFQANFHQRYTIKAYRRTKDSRGKVIFKKPGKMSWRYTTNGNRVVSNGKTLKVYEADNEQMYRQSVDESQYPAALSFLIGGGNITKSFKLKKLDSKRARFPGGYVLLGEPRNPTPAYQKLVMYVDAKTAQVRRVMLIDAQGNRNRFDFSKPVVNKKPPPGEFTFTPPPGTKVIRP